MLTLVLCCVLLYAIKCVDTGSFDVFLNATLLPDDERFDLQLECAATWVPQTTPINYAHRFMFLNNRTPNNIKIIDTQRNGKVSLSHCKRMSRLAFGFRTLSTCSISNRTLTITVKIEGAKEEDLATWTCLSYITDPNTNITQQGQSQSSSLYNNAAVTAFRNQPLEIGNISVILVNVTSTGNVVLGCQIDGLSAPLVTRKNTLRGIPLKNIYFGVYHHQYVGELYNRKSSDEITKCDAQPNPAVSCFTRSDTANTVNDFACDEHSFTLLAEASMRNVTTYEPRDTSLSFVFNATGGAFTVMLNEYLVLESLPRSTSCYSIAGSPTEHICLSQKIIGSLTWQLMFAATKYFRMQVKLVTGSSLRCENGVVLVVLSADCLRTNRLCNEDAGFEVVYRNERVEIREDYASLKCVVGYYYCFDRPRVVGRNARFYVAPVENVTNYNEEFVTSNDVFSDCVAARKVKTARDFITGYESGLVEYTTWFKLTPLTSPIISCPCTQVPRTCPATFPIVATVVAKRDVVRKHDSVVARCAIFDRASPVTFMSNILREPLLSAIQNGTKNHTRSLSLLFPKIDRANIIYNIIGENRILLSCRSMTQNYSQLSLSKIEMKLIQRSWSGIYDDDIYHGNGLLIDPVLFASRYDAVQCRWKDSLWGKRVNIKQVLDAYHELTCQANETYHIDIELVNDTAVRCVLTHAQGCPGVKSLTFANSSCVGLECKYDGHEVSLTLHEQDLTENNTVYYECNAILNTVNSRPLSTAKTLKQLKATVDCGFSNLKPVILQHTFKSGDVQLTCRYPLDIGDIKHCQSGIKKAAIEIEVEKLGTKNIDSKDRWKKTVLWIDYTLQNDGTAHVYANGEEVEFVQFYGFVLPNKRVMTVFVNTKLFDRLTNFGAVGVSVYTHCSFLYDHGAIYSKRTALIGSVIKAYQRAKSNRKHSMFFDKGIITYRPMFDIVGNEEYRVTLVLKLIAGFLSILVLFVVVMATVKAPRYKT